ncbi:HNH endonuclease signature motif containing protein [Sinomonas humi]|uniref:DUF222 domain-containing protein n=1 Tax=Sinomonas humi TaxID=1338436 RepID=A0A0B2AN31_9MICC|nr:HNH endonuclease signature motif containing protein [Sinomonas humi]KHL03175.1 hypothetical protein LK10_10490 [Sinomonas humi]
MDEPLDAGGHGLPEDRPAALPADLPDGWQEGCPAPWTQGWAEAAGGWDDGAPSDGLSPCGWAPGGPSAGSGGVAPVGDGGPGVSLVVFEDAFSSPAHGALALPAAASLSAGEALAVVECAERVIAWATAAKLEALGRLEQALGQEPVPRRGCQPVRFGGAEAHALAVAEAATATGVSEAAAARLVNEAGELASTHREVLEALRAGRIGHQHARVIVDQARTLPPGDAAGFARRGLDRAVTRTGRRRTPAELRSALRRLREREHPESIGSRKEAAGRDRGVWFAPEPDGMCTLTAFLPAEAGLALYQGLDADARTARSHLTPTPGKPRPGDASGRGGGPADAAGAGDASAGEGGGAGSSASVAAAEERTLSQLRADALVHRLLGVPDEAFPGPFRPHITLTIPVRTLLPPHSSHAGGPAPDDATGCDALGCDPTEGDRPQGPQGPERPHEPAGPEGLVGSEGPVGSGSVGSGSAELEGYGPIDAATARRLAALAPNWDRLFTDWDTGAALGVGRTAYRPPQALRRYLAHRDGGCRFPGCTRPAHACEPDHTTEWQDGGTTDPHNLASR